MAKKETQKKGSQSKKVIHPKSREAKRQARHMVRAEHVGKKKQDHAQLLHTKRRTMEWFHENLDASKTTYTDEDMVELIKTFIERHDIEVDYIKSFQRAGEPLTSSKANKVLALEKCKQEEELMLYKTGFEAPDVGTVKKMEKFRAWNKTLQFIHDLPLKKYTAKAANPTPQQQADVNTMEQ